MGYKVAVVLGITAAMTGIGAIEASPSPDAVISMLRVVDVGVFGGSAVGAVINVAEGFKDSFIEALNRSNLRK